MPQIYYALTGIGWGRGSTPSEAVENYLSAQRRNFPHLSEDELQEVWGFVWQAPAGTTGFYDSPRGMTWVVDDGVREWAVPFDPADKVRGIGNVPSQFAL